MKEKIEGQLLEEYAIANARMAVKNIETGFLDRALRLLEAAMKQVKQRIEEYG